MAAHLTGIHSAIKMLNSRVKVLLQYLLAMQKGKFNVHALVLSFVEGVAAGVGWI